MEHATVGQLVVEVLKTGALGFLFSVAAGAIGKREFGSLMKIATIVVCLVLMYQIVALMVDRITEFLEPLMKFLERFTKEG